MDFYKQSPTSKQLAFLKRLGYAGPKPASKGHASDLIDSILRPKRSRKQQHSFLSSVVQGTIGLLVLTLFACGLGSWFISRPPSTPTRGAAAFVTTPPPTNPPSEAAPETDTSPVVVATPEADTSSVVVTPIEPTTPPKEPIQAVLNAETTPPHELASFARATDELLARADQARKLNLFKHDAGWGTFIRKFNADVDALKSKSSAFTPMLAKLTVGSVASDVQTYALKIGMDQSRPEKIQQFRDHLTTLITERDTYLATLGETGSSVIAPPAKPSRREQYTHEFTDITGNFKTTAELLSVSLGVAQLRKPDGKTITIPVAKLSLPDQDWIKEMTQ